MLIESLVWGIAFTSTCYSGCNLVNVFMKEDKAKYLDRFLKHFLVAAIGISCILNVFLK